jgi:TnpA family transposase
MDDTSVPRRTLLTDAQRAALLAIPTDETTLIQHYTPSDEDRRLITRRRRPDTRLGLALQLCTLRYPGRLLRPGEPRANARDQSPQGSTRVRDRHL